MLINNIDIKIFNAIQLQTDIQNTNQKIIYSNLSQGLVPVFISNTKNLKEIKVNLLFNGISRDSILDNISNFMTQFKSLATIKLDGYEKEYKCFLDTDEIKKTANKRKYKLLLTLKGYSEGLSVIEILNRITSKTITVSGNELTPCIVEITPISDIIDLILTGLADDPIIIKNLKANKKVILDGEAQTVTVDGVNKYADTDMWDFPRLVPGSNLIKVSRNSCDITIKYKPRFI